MLRKNINASLPVYCAKCGKVRLNLNDECDTCGSLELTNDKPQKIKEQENINSQKGCLYVFIIIIVIFLITSIVNTNSNNKQNISQNKQQITPAQQAQEDLKFIDEHMSAQEKREEISDEIRIKNELQQREKQEEISVKSSLDKLIARYDLNDSHLDYYIYTSVWNLLGIDEKESLFDSCVEYSGFKNKKETKDFIMYHTKIKDYATGKILGEYKGKFKIN